MDKTGWTKVKLGDIVNIQRGKRLTKKELSEVKNEDTPYKVIHGGIKPLGYYGQYNRKGNVCIVINTGNAGDVHYIDEDFWSSDACYCLYADDKKALNKFIYYQVLANEKYLHSQVRKSAMPTISADPISRLEVYLPDLETQQKIVKLLSTIDNIIQSKLDESTKYQNMKTQIMNDIFNNGEREQQWAKVKLGDIVIAKAGGDIDKSRVMEEPDEIYKYPVYANALTNRGLFGYTDEYKFSGKVVTVTGRGDIGHALARDEYFYPIVRLLVLTPKVALDTKYLEEAINSIKFVSESTGVPQLTAKKIVEYSILLPPIEQQTLIANLLTMYDDVIETVNKEKEDYEKIKTQMMNMIFA